MHVGVSLEATVSRTALQCEAERRGLVATAEFLFKLRTGTLDRLIAVNYNIVTALFRKKPVSSQRHCLRGSTAIISSAVQCSAVQHRFGHLQVIPFTSAAQRCYSSITASYTSSGIRDRLAEALVVKCCKVIGI